MNKNFECQRCGRCCREPIMPDDEKLDYPFKKDTSLVALRQPMISIREWELPKLQQRAKELGIVFSVEPLHVIFDIKSKMTAVLAYTTTTERCPFLDDNNSCRVYDCRPLLCKRWPAPDWLYDVIVGADYYGIEHSTSCPAVMSEEEMQQSILGSKDMVRASGFKAIAKLYEYFGDSLAAAGAFEATMIMEMQNFMELTKDGVFKIAGASYPPLSFLLSG